MEIQFKHMVLIYAVLIFALFLYKPQLFRLNIEDQNLRRRKFTTLVALFIILAIITYYIKIFLSRD
jgi:ABC-type protease/lipase transport system fused ATPase/permease subunit